MTFVPVRHVRAPWRFAVPLALASALLSGCGGEEPAPGDDAAAAPAPTAEEASAAEDVTAPEVIEVEMIDFGYLDLPASVPAGTQLSVTNSSEAELHELVAFRLPDAEDRSVEELLELPPEELMPTLGEPATVLLAAPDGPQIAAVGDGTLTEPGRYAIVCFIPTGVEPDVYLEAAAASDGGPPQVDGGPPHVMQGMYRELIVE
jgi:hypothetical protein